ncbi:hypothetical protein PAMA_006505 [Pampus argenteus]
MLRYLIKTLLQMNLFTDTIRNPSNGTDQFFNASLPSFNSSLLDWGNFTGFNGGIFCDGNVDLSLEMEFKRESGRSCYDVRGFEMSGRLKSGQAESNRVRGKERRGPRAMGKGWQKVKGKSPWKQDWEGSEWD